MMRTLRHVRKLFSEYSLLLLVVLGAILVGYAIGILLSTKTVVVKNGTPDNPAAISSVSLMIDYGNGIVRTWNTVSWQESMSVLDLVQKVGSAENISVETEQIDGKTAIRSIDGIVNSSAQRWKYWLNNAFEPRAAEKAYLRPGDLVIYIYTKN